MVYAEPDRRGPCTVKDTSSCFSAGEIRSVKEVTFTRYPLPLVVLAHGLGLMVHGNSGDAVTLWILLFAVSLPKDVVASSRTAIPPSDTRASSYWLTKIYLELFGSQFWATRITLYPLPCTITNASSQFFVSTKKLYASRTASYTRVCLQYGQEKGEWR